MYKHEDTKISAVCWAENTEILEKYDDCQHVFIWVDASAENR